MESVVSSGVVEWGPFLILLKTSITAKILTLSRVLITHTDVSPLSPWVSQFLPRTFVSLPEQYI